MKSFFCKQLSKRQFAIFLIVAVLISAFFLSAFIYLERFRIGAMFWNTFRWDKVAIVFDPRAGMAMEIGDFYFIDARESGAYDLKKARRYYSYALEQTPFSKTTLYYLGRIDFLEGKFFHALVKFDRYLRLYEDLDHPTSIEVHYFKGLTYGYIKDFESAAQEFKNIILWKGGENISWAVYNDLAWAYFSQGEYQKTKEAAEQGLVYNPYNAWLLNMYGLALLNTGEKDVAEKVLAEALTQAEQLKKEDWLGAYSGNDPGIAAKGLNELVQTVARNLEVAKKGQD